MHIYICVCLAILRKKMCSFSLECHNKLHLDQSNFGVNTVGHNNFWLNSGELCEVLSIYNIHCFHWFSLRAIEYLLGFIPMLKDI